MRTLAGGIWDAGSLFSGLWFLFSLQTLQVHCQEGDGCGHTVLSSRSGTVASRNYPGTYPNRTYCVWNLKVPQGHTLLLTFGDFDLESSQDCRAGSLTVRDKRGLIALGPLCGQLAASSKYVSLNSSEVIVHFESDTHRSGRGFLLSYSTNQHPDLISCLHRGSHFTSQQISVFCPGGCKDVAGEIWGQHGQGYRDTSVLCKAAVHAGVISDSQGGIINVTQKRGITLYESSFANGILSKTGSLSDKRLVFNKACDSPLAVMTYNSSSMLDDEDQLGWAPEDNAKIQLLQWTTSDQDQQPWLELELWSRSNITGLITKGQPSIYNGTYTLMYSRDRKNWKVYKDSSSKEKRVFYAYSDGHAMVLNSLFPPIAARYLQLWPQHWHGRVSVQVQVLGCPLPNYRPRSSGAASPAVKSVPTETVLLPASTEGPVMTKSLSESSSQPMMLVVGVILGVALCVGCLLAVLLWRRRKKVVRMKKCCADSGSQSFSGKKLPYPDSELVSYPLTRNVHESLPNPPLNDYAEPDVLPGGQKVGLTFRPELEEGYTIPFALNHYDTPGQLPEYAEPLPPEPEYATPFSEQCPGLSIPSQLDTVNTHSQLFQTSLCAHGDRVSMGQPEYDCPAHRGLSNGYCTPVINGTGPRKASVIYAEPQPAEPLLQHTYHEPL